MLSPLLLKFALEYAIRKMQENRTGIEWDTFASGLYDWN
jgi:hypothetical protein